MHSSALAGVPSDRNPARTIVERFDVAVIGAGVVGLSVARSLANRGLRTVVLERWETPGTEQSTHNSEVIHAGFHLAPGTLRATLAVAGNPRLYRLARDLGVAHRNSGTLVVAPTAQETPVLRRWLEFGHANGVSGLQYLEALEAREHEPHVGPCSAAIWAPSGGIIDTSGLMRALAATVSRAGGALLCNFHVRNAARGPDHDWQLSGDSGARVLANSVVNAAGIRSAAVAELFGARSYRIYPCLGEYARVPGSRREWVRSMIYGVPKPGTPGIGVHLTRRISGELWLGPTATYQSSDSPPRSPTTSLEEFLREASRLVPGLELSDLSPGSAGVRAKTAPPGAPDPFGDFVIREDPPRSRVVQLIGIESPGLTASVAIGEYVADAFWPGSASGSRGT